MMKHVWLSFKINIFVYHTFDKNVHQINDMEILRPTSWGTSLLLITVDKLLLIKVIFHLKEEKIPFNLILKGIPRLRTFTN